MKKVVIVIALLSCLGIVSCQKTGVDAICGSYTYKTSGALGLLPTASLGVLDIDTTFVTLATESGQMNIVKDNSSSKVVVTWDNLTGDATFTSAVVTDNKFTLDPGKKSVSIPDSVIGIDRTVTYSGTGECFDDMIILPMTYTGTVVLGLVSMTIVSSKVECVAKRN